MKYLFLIALLFGSQNLFASDVEIIDADAPYTISQFEAFQSLGGHSNSTHCGCQDRTRDNTSCYINCLAPEAARCWIREPQGCFCACE